MHLYSVLSIKRPPELQQLIKWQLLKPPVLCIKSCTWTAGDFKPSQVLRHAYILCMAIGKIFLNGLM